MKKGLMSMALLLIAGVMMAQQPVITFEKTTHDFGKIHEEDGRVTTVFQFKNEGMVPLVLSSVRASCGCTTPNWPHQPIEPGEVGDITVTYNPNGRPGRFQKTITVTSNAETATTKLYIKGEVIPKPAKPVNQYTVKMGELSVKSNFVNFGTIKMGDKAQKEIEYANHTDHNLTVEVITLVKDSYLEGLSTLVEIKPGETGKLLIYINTEKAKLYGPLNTQAYVVVNGKEIITDEYKVTIAAEVIEDFSKLTPEQIQLAPIAQVNNTVDFGTVKANELKKQSVRLYNNGASNMLVHRLYTGHKNLIVTGPKSIKAGKYGEIKLTLNTKDIKPGNYTYQLQVITNDPKQPKSLINCKFSIAE